MGTNADDAMQGPPKLLIAVAGMLGLSGSILILSRGWHDPILVTYAGIWAVVVLVSVMWIHRSHLLRERFHPPGDRASALLEPAAMLLLVSMVILGGAYEGRAWRGSMIWSQESRIAALLIVATGLSVSLASVVANRFYSIYLHVQADKGHTVVTGGPYRWIRHPAYLGMVLWGLASPVALGGVLAIVPAAAYAVCVVVRTEREDRFLRGHLPGYAEYAGRVRFRMIPGLW